MSVKEQVRAHAHAGAAELESALRELTELYDRLGSFAQTRHRAIREADKRGIAMCIGEEGKLIEKVTAIEARRARAAATLAVSLGMNPSSSVRELAAGMGGDAGERMHTLAIGLREKIEAVSKINASARSAAEMLSQHMQGLWRRVLAEINGGGVYRQSGCLAEAAGVSGLDVRS